MTSEGAWLRGLEPGQRIGSIRVLWDELFSVLLLLLPCVQHSYGGPFTSAPRHTTASFVGEGVLDVNELSITCTCTCEQYCP